MPTNSASNFLHRLRSSPRALFRALGLSFKKFVALWRRPPLTGSAKIDSVDTYCRRLLVVYEDMEREGTLLGPSPLLPNIYPEAEAIFGQSSDDSEPQRVERKLQLLKDNPRLQASLAAITAYSPSKWLLEQELGKRKANVESPEFKKALEEARDQAATWQKEWDQIESRYSKPSTQILLRQLHALLFRSAPFNSEESKISSLPGFEGFNGEDQAQIKSWLTIIPPKLEEYRALIRKSVEHYGASGGNSWHSKDGATNTSSPSDVYDAAAKQQLAGLCFSGGGIRSATFSLGILQALASHKFIGRFDYLSTVSGGGYIHQWFAAWIRNADSGLATVEQDLIPPSNPGGPSKSPDAINWLRRYSSYLTPRRGVFSTDTWTMLAIWFRNTFLNQIVLFAFLGCCVLLSLATSHRFFIDTPGKTFSSIAWWPTLLVVVAFCSSLRFAFALNTVTAQSQVVNQLNNWERRLFGTLDDRAVLLWLVLPSFLLSYLLALELTGKLPLDPPAIRLPHMILNVLPGFLVSGLSPALACFGLYILFLLLALTFGGRSPRDFTDLEGGPWLRNAFLWCIFSIVAISFAVLFAKGAVSAVQFAESSHLQSTTSSTKSVSVISYVAETIARKSNDRLGHSDSSTSVQAKSSAGTLDVKYTKSSQVILDPPFNAQMLLAAFLPPLLYFLVFVAIRLQIGILGRFYAESRREWLARFGAWGAIVSAVWIALTVVSRLGPVLFQWFFSGSTLRSLFGVLSVVVLHIVTLYPGASGKSDGRPKPNTLFGYSPIDLLGIIGAPFCVLSLLIITAGIARRLVDHSHALVDPARQLYLAVGLGRFQDPLHITSNHNWPLSPLLLGLILLVILLLFGWRVDVNEFSMHGFYRNRLARAYLGASNPGRLPDPFTGFDDHDFTGIRQSGLRLAELLPKRFGAKPGQTGPEAYSGPFPIFCSTLNLTFGEELAWQERKGTSFAFTPMYSGYHVGWTSEGKMGMLNSGPVDTSFNGYVPTSLYAYPHGGVALATTTAICGAALSPNQGFSTQPALAFLMTLFNVRLGWWIANPRRNKVWPATQKKPTPLFGLVNLIQELLGLADDSHDYVCLCDGGRFENMGMYELVRRRCRLIVVCDGEQDQGPKFDGIGKAIAKCRTDFGAEITLDLNPLLQRPATGFAKQHCVWGTIRYPAPTASTLPPECQTGYVIYLKTSITGAETGDILHHRLAYPDFPQDTTLNQWFTESQFESYRRLGEIVGEEAYEYISACSAALAIGGPPLLPPFPEPCQAPCAPTTNT